MSFIEYSSEFDKDIDLIQRRYDIACEKAYHDFLFESIGSIPELITEAEQSSGGFVGFLKKIVTYVTNLIKDTLEMFHNMFHPQDNQNLEAMLKNDRGSFNPGCNLEQTGRSANAKVREGNKLIKLIASGANISEEQVQTYINSGLKTVAIAAPPAIATALGLKWYNSWSKQQEDNANQVKDAASNAENVQDTKKQSMITRIMNTMTKVISESNKAGNAFQKNFNGYINQKSGNKKNTKEAKKNG